MSLLWGYQSLGMARTTSRPANVVALLEGWPVLLLVGKFLLPCKMNTLLIHACELDCKLASFLPQDSADEFTEDMIIKVDGP
jgi:hypothetical protein